MKKIGIISRSQSIKNKEFIGCYINYVKKIKNKAYAFIIPYDSNINILKLVDGIIAPGGDNVGKFDKDVFKYALDNDIPYLGICLGMQVMGELDKIDNHYLKEHIICIKKDTLLYKIYNTDKLIVNSRHHDRVVKTKYMVSAISSDNIIEAIEVMNKKFILGVQWHPEDMIDSKIFDYFIKSL